MPLAKRNPEESTNLSSPSAPPSSPSPSPSPPPTESLPPTWTPLATHNREPPIPIGFSPDPILLSNYDATLKRFQKGHHQWSYDALEERVPSSYKRIATNYNASTAYTPIVRVPMKTYSALECSKRCNNFGDKCHAFGHFKERAPLCMVGRFYECEELNVDTVEVCELYESALRPGDVHLGTFDWGLEGTTMTRAVRAFNGYNKYWHKPGKREVGDAEE
jgi:hypothetical protein